jgi:hypothetical protein
MTVEEYPLYLDVPPAAFNLNYMRNVRNSEWDIRCLPTPLYLFQPDVDPDADGGKVKNLPPARRPPRRGEFVEAAKAPDPAQQHWLLAAANGRVFKGMPDTLSNYAVLRRRDDAFQFQLVDHSIRFFEERLCAGAPDGEAALRKMKEQQRLQARRLQAVAPSLLESVREEALARHTRAAEELELDHEARVDHSDVESDGAPDLDDAPQSDEGVDPTAGQDSDAIEELSDFDVAALWLEEEDDAEEEDEPERAKRPRAVETVSGAAASNQAIVEYVFGPETVTREELRAYLRDVGLCTPKELKHKFRDRLRQPDRAEAFKRLCRECLALFERDGRQYLKLKAK